MTAEFGTLLHDTADTDNINCHLNEGLIEWRTIPECPNYEVSNTGKVRNKTTNRTLSPGITKAGYAQVNLPSENGQKNRYVHRLVARVFIGDPNDDQEVNHKDGHKLNNFATNLEWVTSSENTRHAVENGLIGILSAEDEELIVEMDDAGCTPKEITTHFDCSLSTIYRKLSELRGSQADTPHKHHNL